MQRQANARLKARVIEEFRVFVALAVYLWLFLGSFTTYRRLVLAETGAAYLHYGMALVEALVIAKVVLLGRMFGVGRRVENRALIVPVAHKTVLFTCLVVAFSVIEHLIEGWIRGQGLLGGLAQIRNLGVFEMAARLLVLVVAFVPIFAFGEMGRVMGANRLAAMFFSKPAAPVEAQHPAP